MITFMPANPSIQAILQSQPVRRMQWLARLWGWNDLRLEYVLLQGDAPTLSAVCIYYMTTDDKFNLQINQRRLNEIAPYQATVKASRYGIANNGWHEFSLPDDDLLLRAEAERLRPALERQKFKSPAWRRRFADENPKCLMIHNYRRRNTRFAAARKAWLASRAKQSHQPVA